MNDQFDPSKTYGQFLEISDVKSFNECCRKAALRHLPEGTEILTAVKGNTAAWMYPADRAVPNDWVSEKVII